MHNDRFEYIKQPHIIALIVIGIAILVGAIYTGVSRLQDRSRRASSGTEQACLELVDDSDLCKFAATSEKQQSSSYQSVITTTDASGTTIATIKYESADRMESITQKEGAEIEALVLLDSDAYYKDPADNIWAHYKDEAFEPTELDEGAAMYDFTSETSTDVTEFRNHYKKLGEESCDNLTCLKYQVSVPDDPTVTYIWFDTEQFQLRRYQTSVNGATTNTQFSYPQITITAPSPVKEVTEEAFNALLD